MIYIHNALLYFTNNLNQKCHVCKEKGATIGCFDSKCSKSFHLPCTKKPTSNFKNGVIFWCNIHEAFHDKKGKEIQRKKYNVIYTHVLN